VSTEKFYHPELDGLRFLAFLLVYIHHTPLFTDASIYVVLHKYGWVGVDLFLCLSSFLFARLLYVEYQVIGDISVKNFYVRRALRIWPLYFFFLGVAFLLTAAESGWTADMLPRALGIAVFTDNIFAAFWGYNPFIAAAHLWTISYEEQFYAVIPWFLRKMFSVERRKQITVIVVIFAVFSFFKAWMIYADIRDPAIWVLPITHFESILGGLVVGLGLMDDHLKRFPAWVFMAAGLVCLAIVCALPNGNIISWYLMLTYPLVGLGMSLILLSTNKEEPWFVKNILRHPWLAYLGKISYGLYVYHLLGINYAAKIASIVKIFPRRMGGYPLSVFVVGIILTVAVSMLSYQWLEKPFLRLKARFTSIESRPI
jgi:peptidoglycan/LPS O-acetylase OafA/YrhL